MISWIKKIARLISIGTFFIVFAAGIEPSDPMNAVIGSIALAKALAAALLFWIIGYVLGDIVLKGILGVIETDEIHPLEGGVLQRLREEKEKISPDNLAIAASAEKEPAVVRKKK